ncbi:MAG TPA: branched-chain amino acid ABC transporter permease [Candidatus Dormibacteraeota bacterium]|nr:branched-chain amino acid ABC transporter permease [Candidatus Dormibacteraeota bacterium]
MAEVPTVLVVGLTLGFSFALLSLAFAVVYAVIGEINLAFGDSIVLASFIAYAVYSSSGNYALTALAGIAAGMVLLMLTELLALRPLRGRGDALVPIMATLGLALVMRNAAQNRFGAEDKFFPPLFGSAHHPVAGTSVDVTLAWTAVFVVLLAAGLVVFLQRTDWGRAVRAVRQDTLAARLGGIPVGRVTTLLYAGCGAVGALAALLFFGEAGSVSIPTGFQFTLNAYTAAVLGGGRSLLGAAAGGLLLGLADAVAQVTVGAIWQQPINVAILVLVLVARPGGLARRVVAERV